MSLGRRRDWYSTVRGNWQKTTAYLLASREPCIAIRAAELKAIRENRVVVGVDSAALGRWKPTGSWLLAVILCPGDETAELADWIWVNQLDPSRVHFYLHPKTTWKPLRAWHDAGFPTANVDDDVPSWQRFHQLFGLALSDRIVADWTAGP